MFEYGLFTSHSGLQLPWKVNLDHLTEEDWRSLAMIVRRKFFFSSVIGVPRGGLPFAEALQPFCVPDYPTLIVDDVLTTGRSMEEWRAAVPGRVIGVVVWARGAVPNWVWPMFVVQRWTQGWGTGIG